VTKIVSLGRKEGKTTTTAMIMKSVKAMIFTNERIEAMVLTIAAMGAGKDIAELQMKLNVDSFAGAVRHMDLKVRLTSTRK
jgi:hypothetical protein